MTWKEQFNEFAKKYNIGGKATMATRFFIETKIIEKLIDDIPDKANVLDPYDGYISLPGKDLKQQLKARWLSKE